MDCRDGGLLSLGIGIGDGIGGGDDENDDEEEDGVGFDFPGVGFPPVWSTEASAGSCGGIFVGRAGGEDCDGAALVGSVGGDRRGGLDGLDFEDLVTFAGGSVGVSSDRFVVVDGVVASVGIVVVVVVVVFGRLVPLSVSKPLPVLSSLCSGEIREGFVNK